MPQPDRDTVIIERMLEDYDTLEKRLAYSAMNEQKFCEDHSFEGEYAYDAVMNPLYRIVEDAAHLSESVTSKCPDLPWRQIVGFRNFIAHGYAQVDRRLVWHVIEEDLPELIKALRSC